MSVAHYADPGLCNGRASVRPSVRPSACPIDRQKQRPALRLLLSAGVCSEYRLIAAVTVLQVRRSAGNAGSVMLRADGGGLMQTCYLTGDMVAQHHTYIHMNT